MAGQMVHPEMPAGDTANAREFWGSLFGLQFQEFPGPTEYHMTQFSETTGGAIYAPTATGAGRACTSTSTTSTPGLRARELGGEAGDAMPVPDMGSFAICKDTEGNEFGLWQTDPDASRPGA